MGGSVRRGTEPVLRGGRTVACGIGGFNAGAAPGAFAPPALAAAAPADDFIAFNWPTISLKRVANVFCAV